jgi:hypothetical protein
MKIFKKILVVLLVILIGIQFFHPKKNKSAGPQPNYVGNNFAIPADVKKILAVSCNDCHSNNTRYPWYAKIQPIHWWLNKHIVDGKKHINYDEFTNRTVWYQNHKMEETIDMVKESKMPLNSYTWTHKDARLSQGEKDKLVNWAKSVMDTLRGRFPADSFVRKK